MVQHVQRADDVSRKFRESLCEYRGTLERTVHWYVLFRHECIYYIRRVLRPVCQWPFHTRKMSWCSDVKKTEEDSVTMRSLFLVGFLMSFIFCRFFFHSRVESLIFLFWFLFSYLSNVSLCQLLFRMLPYYNGSLPLSPYIIKGS